VVKAGEIPHHVRGGRVVFFRSEIDAWASARILGMTEGKLREYDKGSTVAGRSGQALVPLLPALLEDGAVDSAVAGKTRSSVIDAMVDLAAKTGCVNDPDELLESVLEREALCSTALPGGLALLHCRAHDSYRFENSFLALGRTNQAIPFGAPDGRGTWFFFLLCCQDEALHLHALARICLVAQTTDLLERFFAASSAEDMITALELCEVAALAGRKRPVVETLPIEGGT